MASKTAQDHRGATQNAQLSILIQYEIVILGFRTKLTDLNFQNKVQAISLDSGSTHCV